MDILAGLQKLSVIVTFVTERFVRYSRHVRYLRGPLLGGFTVLHFLSPDTHSLACVSGVRNVIFSENFA